MDGFQLGPLRIYWYSLCLLFAVWLAYWVALLCKKRSSLNLNQAGLTDIFVMVLVFGVIGARIGYVLQNWDYFSNHSAAIFFLSTGGLSIHGAIVGGLLSLIWYARKHRVHLADLTDLLVLPLLTGQIIGRLGNYFNQELYGYPTAVFWKIFIDTEHRLPRFSQDAYYHPTFLYEMVLNAIGLAFLWRWQPKKSGQLTGGYLLVFAISRFVTEIYRISDRIVWSLSTAQIISIGLALVSYPLILGTANNILQKLQNSLTYLRQNRD